MDEPGFNQVQFSCLNIKVKLCLYLFDLLGQCFVDFNLFNIDLQMVSCRLH